MRVLTKYILLVFLCAVTFPSFGQVKLPVSKKIVVSASGKVGGLTAEQFISRTMANPAFTRGLSAADQYALAQSLELALTRRIQSTVLPPSLPTRQSYILLQLPRKSWGEIICMLFGN